MSINTENKNDFIQHVHYDRDLEFAVLGACLLDKTSFARVQGILNIDCFYFSGTRIVYQAIFEMWDKSIFIDMLTVVNWMARQGFSQLENYNTAAYIGLLTQAVVTSAHLEYHALLIRQMFAERELIKLKYLKNDSSQDTLTRIKKIQDDLTRISMIKVVDDWSDMSEVLIKLYQHMDEVKDKELIGVPTGFEKLDLVTGGLVKTNLVVIGARPSVGKSALLNSIVLHAANNGYKVGVISLEMPKVQIGARMGAVISDIEFWKIYRNRLQDENEAKRLHEYLGTLSELPIMISDKTNVNINDIKAKAAQLIHKNKLDILFIDYLQLVETETQNRNFNREQEVARLSRGLKLMAMEYNIPVVVLAQLNRESEKSSTKKPQLHNLRESGAIEQDADGVIFLHRDWKAGILQDENGNSTEREADLIIAKWRNGEIMEVKIGFDPPKMRFYNLDRIRMDIEKQSGWKPYKED